MKKSLLHLSFFILLVLGAMHLVGVTFYLYWNLRWFDSLAHFLGGAGVSLFFLWIWYDSGLFGRNTPSRKSVFIVSLLSGMIAGFGWEFFELVNGIANPIGSYPLDTFNDLLADFVGAVSAGIAGANKSFYE